MTKGSALAYNHKGGSSTKGSPHAPLFKQWLTRQYLKRLMGMPVKFIDMEKSIRYSTFADRDLLKFKPEEGVFLAIGVGSVQPDEKHVLFLDLDGYDKQECEAIAREVISKVGVSDCYIIQSSPGNHHLVSLDLIEFELARKIARAYGHEAWAKFRGLNEDFVLRIGPKLAVRNGQLIPVPGTMPKLVSVVKSPFSYREKSNSLRRIFRNVWGYDIKRDDFFNDNMKFRMHIYKIRMVGMGKQVEFNAG